jgi:hypothetical protein
MKPMKLPTEKGDIWVNTATINYLQVNPYDKAQTLVVFGHGLSLTVHHPIAQLVSALEQWRP